MKAFAMLILIFALIGFSLLFTAGMNLVLDAAFPEPGAAVSWCGGGQ